MKMEELQTACIVHVQYVYIKGSCTRTSVHTHNYYYLHVEGTASIVTSTKLDIQLYPYCPLKDINFTR